METGSSHRWWILIVLCLSSLVLMVDGMALTVAVPQMTRDIGATAQDTQWILDSYILVFAGLLLTSGSLGDRFGRKGTLSIGLVVFGVGSVASAFATSAGTLIAFRALAGVGGALIMPATLSILTNVFPSNERGRAIGIWAGVSGIGIVAGPLAGGWLLEHFWWGSVFLINVPVVLIALVAGHVFVPTSRDPNAPRLDLAGTVLASTGLAALLYGIIEAPSEGWGNPAVLTAFAVGLVGLVAFVAWEAFTDHPMLEIGFFRNPRFSAANIAVTLVFFAMFGSLYFLTQYLQYVLGYSAMTAGAALIPLALMMMIMAPNSARLAGRFGTKLVVAGGLAIVAGALAMLSFATVSSPYEFIAVVLALLGLGMSIAMAPATESIMGSLPKEKAGVGSAMNDTTRQVGGALGVAVLGSITAASYHASIDGSSVVAALPPQAQAVAHDSIGGAVAVAHQLPVGGAELIADASQSFVHAMNSTVLIGAAIALVGALVALVFLPARASDEIEEIPAVYEGDPELEAAAA
jgi:EmrB/QacA subfamily drug resistance transporter